MATRGLGIELLRLLCEGMGLRPDYFERDLTAGDVIINVNHYPPCPDPSLTLGLPPHCDRNLITLLLQGDVFGLQVSYNGDWINVDPVPDAFVVNFGHLLEVRIIPITGARDDLDLILNLIDLYEAPFSSHTKILRRVISNV